MTEKAVLVGGLLAALLAGCSSEEHADTVPRSDAQTAAPPVVATSAAPQAAPTCPNDVAAPKQLVKDANASAVQLVGSNVFYLSNGGLMKVGVDGTGPVQVFPSAALVHAWVHGDMVLTIENGDDTPDAVVRATPLADATDPDADGTELTPPATWNAAGTRVVAQDADNLFLVGDEDGGEAVYQYAVKEQAFTQLVAPDGAVVTSLQASANALWFVRDNTHVFHLDRAATDATPAEAFTTDAAGCGLVVSGQRALCVQSTAIQARDLDGKNAAPLFDLTKSRVQASFSVGLAAGDAVLIAASSALRAVTIATGTEKVLACGRDNINSVDADTTNTVWTESGKDAGVWLAPR